MHRVPKISYSKVFLFFQHLYLDKRYKYRQHRGMTQFCLLPLVSDLYIRKRSSPKTDSCRTPKFISPASGKKFSSIIKTFLFKIFDWNYLMIDSSKPIDSIFCKTSAEHNLDVLIMSRTHSTLHICLNVSLTSLTKWLSVRLRTKNSLISFLFFENFVYELLKCFQDKDNVNLKTKSW